MNLRNYEDQLLHAGEPISTMIKKYVMLKNLSAEFLYIVSLCKMNKEYILEQIKEGLKNHEPLIKNQQAKEAHAHTVKYKYQQQRRLYPHNQ